MDSPHLALAHVVHDLRNQLLVILGCVDSLACLSLPDEGAETVGELRAATQRAALLARHILLTSRPPAPDRRLVDLNEVVRASVSWLVRTTGNRIHVQLDLAVRPLRVVADYVELERIVTNLVLNARDAVTGEGVLHIATSLRAEGARLVVSDTGSGLTAEAKARMFEPYFTTKENGTGLGLSSVATTVNDLGGAVFVDSEPGRGTRVTVVLPVASTV